MSQNGLLTEVDSSTYSQNDDVIDSRPATNFEIQCLSGLFGTKGKFRKYLMIILAVYLAMDRYKTKH